MARLRLAPGPVTPSPGVKPWPEGSFPVEQSVEKPDPDSIQSTPSSLRPGPGSPEAQAPENEASMADTVSLTRTPHEVETVEFTYSDPITVPPVDGPAQESRASAGFAGEDLFIGKILANRYKVARRVGVGGFGAVYEAEDTKIHKRVAVKVLARDLVSDASMVVRFRKEAEAASKVGHENIIDITDFDRTADGYYFIVMEFLEGTDLGSVLRSGEQLSMSRILGIMIQVCRGLHQAHLRGVIHRDLKPGNIFLSSRGSLVDFVKLLDFGITKFTEIDDAGSRLTKTGQIIGTPMYMSPEQAMGEEDVDHRADIYSLGVILYELVTGQPPFTAVNYLGLIAQHATDPPVPPTKVRPDLHIPLELEQVILKAMAKRPEERFATMSELEGSLVHILATIDPAVAVTYSGHGTPPSLLTANTGISQRRLAGGRYFPMWLIFVVAAAIGVAGAILASYSRNGPGGQTLKDGGNGPKLDGGHRPMADSGAAQDTRGRGPDGAVAGDLVRVRITSVPDGAEVVDQNGALVGTTPLELRLPRSATTRAFTVRKSGYRPARQDVTAEKDRVLHLVLKRRVHQVSLPDDPKGWGTP